MAEFRAKYRSSRPCPVCGLHIEVGQLMSWTRRALTPEDKKVYHAECRFKGTPTPTPVTSVTPVPLAPTPQPKPDTLMAKKLEDAGFKPKTLKDNAPWYDILSAIVKWAKDSGKKARILLIGPPGTGKSKTSLVVTNTSNRVTFTEGMGIEDLLGMYQLIDGSTVWCDGPVVTAMRKGEAILFDEVDHTPTEIQSALYGWIDDQPHATLPNGEIVNASNGYCVIGTTNSNITSLPEAIFDRFDAVLLATTPHPDALRSLADKSMEDLVSNHFRGLPDTPWKWSGKPTFRRVRSFQELKPVLGENNAAKVVFGDAGKEVLSILTTSSRRY